MQAHHDQQSYNRGIHNTNSMPETSLFALLSAANTAPALNPSSLLFPPSLLVLHGHDSSLTATLASPNFRVVDAISEALEIVSEMDCNNDFGENEFDGGDDDVTRLSSASPSSSPSSTRPGTRSARNFYYGNRNASPDCDGRSSNSDKATRRGASGGAQQ
jgi:hypothetical protein